MKLLRWIYKIFTPANEKVFLLGDLDEIYESMKSEKGSTIALLWCTAQVLKSIPFFITDKLKWGVVMFLNYLKLAFRIISKNKGISFINIFGLSIAIGVSILSFLFVDFHYNRDSFHENLNKIFLIGNTIDKNGETQKWGNSPTPLGPKIKADFPSVERVVRLKNFWCKVRHGDNVFKEGIMFADEEFFDMFTFPLTNNNPKPLSETKNVVLSKDAAIKYFGTENAVGQELRFTFLDNKDEMFVVSGVAEEFPDNAGFTFNILLPFQNAYDLGIIEENDWKDLTRATFIQVNHPGEIKVIENSFNNFLSIQNAAEPDRKMTGLFLEPLTTLAENSVNINANIIHISLHAGQLLSILFLGITFIGLASFNYMNISISYSAKRFREIGVRKVVGSDRKNLIYQFITENFILCLLAIIPGYLLGKYFFVPWFNQMFGVFQFNADIFENFRLLVFFAGLITFIVLISGLYPALYISSFNVTSIFRAKANIGGSRRLTKILLGFQLGFSLLAISDCIVFIQNSKYQYERDWGYDKESTICIPLESENQFERLRNSVKNNPNIKFVAGSREHLGYQSSNEGIQILDEKYNVEKFDIGFNYFETYGVDLKDGRYFSEDTKTDIENAVMVNETFIKSAGINNPINEKLLYGDKPYYIIGVVKDFHSRELMRKIEPSVYFVKDDSASTYLHVAFKSGAGLTTMDFVKDKWKELFPDSPFVGFFQNDIYGNYLYSMKSMAEFTTFYAIIALLITCMGILGIVSLNISSKMKELGMRKVLGASNLSLAGIINKSFVKTIIISSVISLPLAYYMMKTLMDSMWTYHAPVDAVPFAIAFGILIIASFFTLSYQTSKAVRTNPVDNIKTE